MSHTKRVFDSELSEKELAVENAARTVLVKNKIICSKAERAFNKGKTKVFETLYSSLTLPNYIQRPFSYDVSVDIGASTPVFPLNESRTSNTSR
ncbi:hypothetical protein AB4401_10895 [Vibrio cyclitrophicus]|uniref:Uncharacterized protein n=2 Tax=Vibrio TaxID=662 RepID=A0A2N7NDJ8_9VIBR|nr:hypothetical protein [Vibrio tasmaniensis]OEF90490.1 hypothetical protein A162_07385 [Vibrio tasmaniensis 1F-155]PMO74368.1 hypothetical protein BCT01_01740 [Vibrio tasmaniensis]PMP10689.1 hypothetical protein BCS92_22495 [Vibrio tasmaniensis]TKG35582.1 hypothetical protein FC063_24775 [Vibrio tasmaniensis]TKG44257.1 hypothetical protein FC060_18140 [Vibrio tasmaniensis]